MAIKTSLRRIDCDKVRDKEIVRVSCHPANCRYAMAATSRRDIMDAKPHGWPSDANAIASMTVRDIVGQVIEKATISFTIYSPAN
jgi:hypothetical protein